MSQDSVSVASSLPSERLRRFATALQELGKARDVDDALQLTVDLAAELIPGIDFADVMFVRSGQVTTPIATDPTAVAVDHAQQEAGEGPCLSALREHGIVVSRDLEQEDRWPKFTPRALELGVRSVAAFRLFREREREDRFGALNMFGMQPGLDDFSVELGAVFAAHCSAVLGSAISDEGLQRALQSRDIIGQAKGILMERHKLTADQAYAVLRRTSSQHNIKVRDLAEYVTETGALP